MKSLRKLRGFTLLEAVILSVVLGIVALGVGVGLQSAARVPEGADRFLEVHARLVEKMEDLQSLPFATLLANSGLSDTVSVGGQTLNRTVAVANIDANGDGTADSDMIEVSVTIGSQSLKTRVVQP